MCFLWFMVWKLLTVASKSNSRRTIFLSVKYRAQMLASGPIVFEAGGIGIVGVDRLGELVLGTIPGVVVKTSLRKELRLDLSIAMEVLLLSLGALMLLGS